jgi:hypothetical protein
MVLFLFKVNSGYLNAFLELGTVLTILDEALS